MSLPLPLRLSLFYTLLLGLSFAFFGYLVYHQAEQRAYSDLDSLLKNRAASIKMGKDLFYNPNDARPTLPFKLPGVNELGADGVAIEIFDTQLVLQATSTDASEGAFTTSMDTYPSPIPWDLRAARQLLARFTHTKLVPGDFISSPLNGVYSTVLYEGQLVRVYTTLNNPLGNVQLIQTARSELSIQQSLDQLRQTLFAGALLGLALALVGGLCLTWGTLATLRRVTRTAREISASQDFRRRVPLSRQLGRDESTTLAETFNAMLANLESSYQQQKRFVADASHELRAPLTSIRCNLDLLARVSALPSEEREAILADARIEADRISRLVNNLLTLARADEIASFNAETRALGANAMLPQHSEVDLDSLVLEVFRQYNFSILKRVEQEQALQPLPGGENIPFKPENVEWKGNKDTDTGPPKRDRPRLTLQHIVPARVSGEADQLKQVIVALIDNALKYTPVTGSVTLDLSVERDEAIFKVSDTGIGIAPEDLPHIFERFYRADHSHLRERDGSGLGLAIVRSIAEAQHGHIAVESTPGQGSTFSLYLPRIPDEDL